MKNTIVLLAFSALLLVGCVTMSPTPPKEVKQTSAFIVWKSPQMKYADMGFIEENGENLKVEIYSSGAALMRLVVTKNQICMGTFSCISKSEFNARLLSPHYPPDTVENIFKGEPIYDGEKMVTHEGGFTQKIGEIAYSVNDQVINFTDKTNEIQIKVTKI